MGLFHIAQFDNHHITVQSHFIATMFIFPRQLPLKCMKNGHFEGILASKSATNISRYIYWVSEQSEYRIRIGLWFRFNYRPISEIISRYFCIDSTPYSDIMLEYVLVITSTQKHGCPSKGTPWALCTQPRPAVWGDFTGARRSALLAPDGPPVVS